VEVSAPTADVARLGGVAGVAGVALTVAPASSPVAGTAGVAGVAGVAPGLTELSIPTVEPLTVAAALPLAGAAGGLAAAEEAAWA